MARAPALAWALLVVAFNAGAVPTPPAPSSAAAPAPGSGPSSSLPGRVVIILTPHRAGSSCLSGCLLEGVAGLSLGPSANRDFDWVNPRGYHENDALSALFNKVLAAGNASWADDPTRLLRAAGAAATGGASAESPIKALTERFQGELVALLRREMAGAASFLIKDPRALQCWPLLVGALRELGYHGGSVGDAVGGNAGGSGRGGEGGSGGGGGGGGERGARRVVLVANQRPCDEVASSFAKAQASNGVTFPAALVQCRAFARLVAAVCYPRGLEAQPASSAPTAVVGVAGVAASVARLAAEVAGVAPTPRRVRRVGSATVGARGEGSLVFDRVFDWPAAHWQQLRSGYDRGGNAHGDGGVLTLPDHPWPCFAHEYHSLLGDEAGAGGDADKDATEDSGEDENAEEGEEAAARHLVDLWRFVRPAEADGGIQGRGDSPREGFELEAARRGVLRCVAPAMRHERSRQRSRQRSREGQTSPSPRVAYVIATYGGSGRHVRGASDPIHPKRYLKLHLVHLTAVASSLLRAVLLVRPPIDEGQTELEGFYDVRGEIARLKAAKPGLKVRS